MEAEISPKTTKNVYTEYILNPYVTHDTNIETVKISSDQCDVRAISSGRNLSMSEAQAFRESESFFFRVSMNRHKDAIVPLSGNEIM